MRLLIAEDEKDLADAMSAAIPYLHRHEAC